MKLVEIEAAGGNERSHKWHGFVGIDHSQWAFVTSDEGKTLHVAVTIGEGLSWYRLGDCGHIDQAQPTWWPEGVASSCHSLASREWWLRQIFNAATGVGSDREIVKHGSVSLFDCQVELLDKEAIDSPSRETLQFMIVNVLREHYDIDEIRCSITRCHQVAVQIDSEGQETKTHY